MVSAARVPPTGQSAFEKAVATYRACVSLYAHNRSEAVQLRQFLTMLRLDTVRPDPSQNPLESIVQLNLAWGLGAIIEIQEAAGTRLEFPHQIMFSNSETEWYKDREEKMANDIYESFVSATLRFLLTNEDNALLKEVKEDISETESEVVTFLLGQFAISKGSDDSEEISHEVHVEDVPKYLNGVVTNDEWSSMVLRHSDHTYGMRDDILLEPLAMRLTVMLLTQLKRLSLLRLLSWSVLRQLVPYADGKTRSGPLKELQARCYRDVSDMLEAALVSKYIYNVVTVDALRDTAYMGRRIRESVKATVGNSGWLPRTAQNAARRKVKSMRLFIGFPLNLTRLALLEEFYEDLPDVTLASTAAEGDGETVGGKLSNGGSSFVLSWLNASRFQRRAQIRHPTEIMFTLAAANAQNTYPTNTVNIAAALVQPVVYFFGAVAGYNYGGIGSVIGHEMMHAFDVRGRGYDETGAESKWWPKRATGKYTAQALCLRSSHEEALQKRRAVVLDPTLDSENLADVMGVRVAFDAFRNLTAMVPRHEGASIEVASSVSVAGFNERQLFFIAHCAKQCDPKPPPRMRDPRVPYAPNWSRCVVPLMQMPEFSEAFNCARGTLMNPDKKCRFW
ncbi:neprilysin-1-like [Haemaphysalis longicornis]